MADGFFSVLGRWWVAFAFREVVTLRCGMRAILLLPILAVVGGARPPQQPLALEANASLTGLTSGMPLLDSPQNTTPEPRLATLNSTEASGQAASLPGVDGPGMISGWRTTSRLLALMANAPPVRVGPARSAQLGSVPRANSWNRSMSHLITRRNIPPEGVLLVMTSVCGLLVITDLLTSSRYRRALAQRFARATGRDERACGPCVDMWTLVYVGVAVGIVSDMYFAMFTTFFPAEAHEKGLSPAVVGAIFSATALASAVFSASVPLVLLRVEATRVLRLATLIQAAAAFAFGTIRLIPSTPAFGAVAVALRLLQGAALTFVEASAGRRPNSSPGPSPARSAAH